MYKSFQQLRNQASALLQMNRKASVGLSMLFNSFVVLQEYCYNMGRAMHHLGLLHLSVEFYNQALETKPIAGEPSWKFEAAHNLVQILKSSGAKELAREVMTKHLTL